MSIGNKTLWLIGILGCLGLLLEACIPSLNPFYTPKDVIADDALVGSWCEATNPRLAVVITRNGQEKSYTIVMRDDKQGTFTAHLFQLKGQLFIDLLPVKDNLPVDDGYALYLVPTHTIARIALQGDTLRAEFLDIDKIMALLKAKPQLLALAMAGPQQDIPVLTAPTEQMQAFVIEHMKDVFLGATTYHRQARAGAPLTVQAAAARAAQLANDACLKQFGKRPFSAANWKARLVNEEWHWGEMDPKGIGGYSAEVKFKPDGSDPQVKVFLSNDSLRPTLSKPSIK